MCVCVSVQCRSVCMSRCTHVHCAQGTRVVGHVHMCEHIGSLAFKRCFSSRAVAQEGVSRPLCWAHRLSDGTVSPLCILYGGRWKAEGKQGCAKEARQHERASPKGRALTQ